MIIHNIFRDWVFAASLQFQKELSNDDSTANKAVSLGFCFALRHFIYLLIKKKKNPAHPKLFFTSYISLRHILQHLYSWNNYFMCTLSHTKHMLRDWEISKLHKENKASRITWTVWAPQHKQWSRKLQHFI
jgi:hypothetical protein